MLTWKTNEQRWVSEETKILPLMRRVCINYTYSSKVVITNRSRNSYVNLQENVIRVIKSSKATKKIKGFTKKH